MLKLYKIQQIKTIFIQLSCKSGFNYYYYLVSAGVLNGILIIHAGGMNSAFLRIKAKTQDLNFLIHISVKN